MKVLQQKPMRVAEFEAYLARLQGFLRRDEVEIDGVTSTMSRLDDIDPSLEAAKPPVNVAATGPRTIDVAARLADGVSFSVGADLERLQRSIGLARDACRAAGRDPDTLALGCYVQVAVTDDGDTRARARRSAASSSRTRASRASRRPPPRVCGAADHGEYRQAVEAMESRVPLGPRRRRAHAGRRAGRDRLLPARGRRRRADRPFAIAGSAEHCAERLREIVDLGITRVYIGTRSVGVDLEERNSDRDRPRGARRS